MRVSTFGNYQQNLFNIEQISTTMAQEQQQISSGRAFTSVSQNPQAANQEMLLNESQNQLNEYQNTIKDAQGYLSSQDSIFGSITTVLQDVQTKAVQAGNGTMNSADMNTLASQINQDINQVVTLINSKYAGKYVFSGSQTGTPPFTYNGTTAVYNGDSNQSSFQVSPTLSIPSAPTGNVAFQGVLNAMIALKNQVSANNSAGVQSTLATFQTQMDNVVNQHSQVGSLESTLNSMKSLYSQISQSLSTELSSTVSVNMTKVLSALNTAQMVYQATLDATVKAQKVTILNYM